MLKQLSVFVENGIGTLARVTSVLHRAEFNIRAIASFDSPEFSIMRLIVDRPVEAKAELNRQGFAVKVTEVVAVELLDRPGDLDRVLCLLSDAGLCVNYVYSFVLRLDNAPLILINADDNEKAEEVLGSQGIKVMTQAGL